MPPDQPDQRCTAHLPRRGLAHALQQHVLGSEQPEPAAGQLLRLRLVLPPALHLRRQLVPSGLHPAGGAVGRRGAHHTATATCHKAAQDYDANSTAFLGCEGSAGSTSIVCQPSAKRGTLRRCCPLPASPEGTLTRAHLGRVECSDAAHTAHLPVNLLLRGQHLARQICCPAVLLSSQLLIAGWPQQQLQPPDQVQRVLRPAVTIVASMQPSSNTRVSNDAVRGPTQERMHSLLPRRKRGVGGLRVLKAVMNTEVGGGLVVLALAGRVSTLVAGRSSPTARGLWATLCGTKLLTAGPTKA